MTLIESAQALQEILSDLDSEVRPAGSPSSINPGFHLFNCYATRSKMNTQKAFFILKKAMKDDPDYAWSWHCNIAVTAQDAGAPYGVANEGAARFMKLCFDVDTKRPA